ncbi:MAG: glycosyltransferase family 2 protein [Solirubrobacteraceae bacterium]|nr:glycosyltransferase family 2 protein [Solirubrobacteraceae bacterium]
MTERCLESLERVLGPALGTTIELVLVDNASPDDTLELLNAWADRAQVIALPENRNFAGGCNAGGRAARGDAVIFLNNDTVVEPGVMEGLAHTVLEPGVAAAGPRLLYADGTIQHAGVVAIRRPTGAVFPYHAHHYHDGTIPAACATHEVDMVTGACLAIRRSVFLELDGMDEAYVNGYEDIDLCLRVRLAGHAIVYRGDLAFLHDEGATRGQNLNDLANQKRFSEYWSPLLDPDEELAGRTWGSTVDGTTPVRDRPETTLAMVGQPRGLGSASDEIRAFVLATALAGKPAVALELPISATPPVIEGDLGRALDDALRRRQPERALRFDVHAHGLPAPEGLHRGMLRVVRAADIGPVPAGTQLLPAVPGDDGFWVPPPVHTPHPRATDRAGVIVSLPTHRPELAAEVLAALRAVDATDVRIVPTVGSRGLQEQIADALPDAELLRPCAHDDAWRVAAETAEIAVCVDPDDVFDRRALIAAAVGATPVATSGDGPAGAVLPEVISAAGGSLDHALAAARERVGDGAELAAVVREVCDPVGVARQLYTALDAYAVAAA